MVFQEVIKITQQGKGVYDITELISSIIKESNITTGTCQIYSQSSSSALLISDTADESTKKDTADFLAHFAPSDEGIINAIADSMNTIPKNLKYIMHKTSVSFPVSFNKPGLGVWQGIYLWQKNESKNPRKITVTIIGE